MGQVGSSSRICLRFTMIPLYPLQSIPDCSSHSSTTPQWSTLNEIKSKVHHLLSPLQNSPWNSSCHHLATSHLAATETIMYFIYTLTWRGWPELASKSCQGHHDHSTIRHPGSLHCIPRRSSRHCLNQGQGCWWQCFLFWTFHFTGGFIGIPLLDHYNPTYIYIYILILANIIPISL